LSLEIFIDLILATSAQSNNCSELSILIVLTAIVAVDIAIAIISRISGAQES
jgi:hypothetical protein